MWNLPIPNKRPPFHFFKPNALIRENTVFTWLGKKKKKTLKTLEIITKFLMIPSSIWKERTMSPHMTAKIIYIGWKYAWTKTPIKHKIYSQKSV